MKGKFASKMIHKMINIHKRIGNSKKKKRIRKNRHPREGGLLSFS